ncbi:MAG: nickel pincer cofactor biosynthesis protein LarB [Planctomycetota bacterium]|nr:nickel pincer cofactor biosynthesis protein LarB [Planctomycetota bacterium]
MQGESLRALLEAVKEGRTGVEEAFGQLRKLPFESLGFATVDHHRAIRCGFPEAIFCQGKSADQIVAIFKTLAATGGDVLATRAAPEQFRAVKVAFSYAKYHEAARCITLQQIEKRPTVGTIALVAAGTSDLPVIEEARVTCQIMGQKTEQLYDVGVAGLHRLLAQAPTLHDARVVVVAAGMEGALASVVGGLIAAPVIAVPTSVGYGASFGGITALLAMLNTCAPGVTVVNIDNGFGAGYMASVINRLGEAKPDK